MDGVEGKEIGTVQFEVLDKNKDGTVSKQEVRDWVLLKVNLLKVSFAMNVQAKAGELKLLGLSEEKIKSLEEKGLGKIDFRKFAQEMIDYIFEITKEKGEEREKIGIETEKGENEGKNKKEKSEKVEGKGENEGKNKKEKSEKVGESKEEKQEEEEVLSKKEYLDWYCDPIERMKLLDGLQKMVKRLHEEFADEVKKLLRSMAEAEL